MPYLYKKKVLEAAITSSLLYGCESWLSGNIKEIDRLYIGAVKAMLGVRETTRSDTALIEAGMPSLKELIDKRTVTFLRKELSAERTLDTPLIKIYKICESKRTGGFRTLENILNSVARNQQSSLKENFSNATTSKAVMYKRINPNLSLHEAYTTTKYVNERERLAFTKFRLSSHHLKIETWRWARIAAEDRVCDCGQGVQDESHVLFLCPKTANVRERFGVIDQGFSDIGELMCSLEVHKLVTFTFECMKIFE